MHVNIILCALSLRFYTFKKLPVDGFELWYWRRLLSPLDCKEINQSILKKISPEYSLEELMLKLKLKYFGHLMQKTDSLEKILFAGKD